MGHPPRQIPIANEVFAPTAEEIAAAKQSVETYRAAEADGVGAIGHDGRLVDAAHMRLAENVLHKASLAEGDTPDEAVGLANRWQPRGVASIRTGT